MGGEGELLGEGDAEISKDVIFFGQQVTLACDGNCAKAWGINGRPKHYFQGEEVEPDDYVFLPDSQLGRAPAPGLTVICSEGSDAKPVATRLTNGERMNRWCARECERRVTVDRGEPIALPDMERPKPNMPWLHDGAAQKVGA